MKTKQLLFFGLLNFVSIYLGNAQNIQTAILTSGGLEAGTTTSGAGENTFYGHRAGKIAGGTAFRNTFIGSKSAMYFSTGSENTFLGAYSGPSISSGSRNTFIGANSGAACTTCNGNTFIGRETGYSNNGGANIFIGDQTGLMYTGSNSILFGTGTAENNYYGTDNIMIGNYSGQYSGDSSNNIFIGNYSGYEETSGNKLFIEALEDGTPLIWGDFANDQLKFNGKVGVGYGFGNYPTTAGSVNIANYNLFVKGGILTEEVRVSLTSTWADYVFKKDYKLPTLQEVEKQIQEKGHLFNVPSAQQIKNDGIELGEMAKIQQEKIEELTLYIIEQNKTNEKQSQILDKQSQEIETLKSLLKTIIEKK